MAKWKKGQPFLSIVILALWLENGHPIYLRDKFLSAGWASSMQLRYLINQVKQGAIFKAQEATE